MPIDDALGAAILFSSLPRASVRAWLCANNERWHQRRCVCMFSQQRHLL